MIDKIIPGSLLLAALIFSGAALKSPPPEAAGAREAPSVRRSAAREAGPASDDADIFGGAEGSLLDKTRIDVTLTRSTVTEHSQAYDVTFASQYSTETFFSIGNTKNTYIWIDDPMYTGEEAPQEDPALRPDFNGAAFRVQGVRRAEGVVIIPEKLISAKSYTITVTEILPRFIVDPEEAGKIKKVIIGKTIKKIDEHSFDLLSDRDDCEFDICADEHDPTLQYDRSCFPAECEVNFGYEPAGLEKSIVEEAKTAGFKDFPNGENFILGYYPDVPPGDYKKEELGLTIAYFINGEDRPRKQMLKAVSKNDYDAIGEEAGQNSLGCLVDIYLETGQSIDDDRIYFLNIFPFVPPSQFATNNWKDTRCYAHARCTFGAKVSLDNYLKINFSGVTSFDGYTTIENKVDVLVTPENHEYYSIFKPAEFFANKNSLDKGALMLRTRFTQLNLTSIIMRYLDADGAVREVEVPIRTPLDYYNLPKVTDNTLAILIKNSDVAPDFSAKRIVSAQLRNFYITMDIFSTKEQRIVTKSALQTRFGIIELMPAEVWAGKRPYEVDTAIWAVMVAYAGCYAILSVVFFFYFRNKYKNNEFRRVDPKAFLKHSLIGFAGMGIAMLFLMFVYFRFWVLNNSIVVFNPLDPYVIVFAVASIFVIGYYVKYFIDMYKAARERKKVERLNLSEVTEETGTELMPENGGSANNGNQN